MSGFYRLFSRQEQRPDSEKMKRERENVDKAKLEAMKSTGDVENCFMVQIKFLKDYIARLEDENKKKLDAAAAELGEKAEENAVLYNKLETANAQIKALEAENKRLKDGLVTQRSRNRSVSTSGPNSVFQRLQASNLDASPLKALAKAGATQEGPASPTTAVAVTTTKITSAIESSAEIRRKDEIIEGLNKKLAEETNAGKSLKSSIAEYEKKIVALEKKLQDSLEKEKQKRMIAESNAKRFKQKIRNMQFIIDDLQSQIDNEDSSDNDEDDDDDEKSGSGSSGSDSDDD